MYSVPMAMIDFIPVILFGASAFLLQKDLYNKASKGAYSLFCAGTIDVFMAGFLKGLYKLLYALAICDFEPLSQLFFPLQALGFVMTGVSMLCIVLHKQGKGKIYSITAVPPFYSGTFIFVTLMVLGLGGLNVGLGLLAKRMKKPAVILLFVISFIFSMMMGYLSSKDFTKSMMNWIAECVNVIGQLSLFLGVWILHRSGLEQFQIRED